MEVTKLSLLLKVLEGENRQTLMTQFKLFHERALPDLDSNIKCGNWGLCSNGTENWDRVAGVLQLYVVFYPEESS